MPMGSTKSPVDAPVDFTVDAPFNSLSGSEGPKMAPLAVSWRDRSDGKYAIAAAAILFIASSGTSVNPAALGKPSIEESGLVDSPYVLPKPAIIFLSIEAPRPVV